MATVKVNIVEDNTAPPQQFTLKRDGTVINLTGCTVKLVIAKGSTITNTGHQSAVVTTPTSGLITYTPQAADFSTPGKYKCDIVITYGDATVETMYEQVVFNVRRRLQ